MNRYAGVFGLAYVILFVLSLIMEWNNIFNVLILLGLALWLRDVWRRIRNGQLIKWEIRDNLKQIGILCAVVFVFCLVFAVIADSVAPGRYSTGDFIRAFIVLSIIGLILWAIGHANSKRYDPFDN